MGEKISVLIARQNHTNRANKDENWQVEINPMPSSKVGYTLTVEGQNRIEIEDVLVGEVWLCPDSQIWNGQFQLHMTQT